MMDKINRLILLCLKARNDQSIISEINEVVRDKYIGWSSLIAESSRHRVIPLVVKGLADTAPSSDSSFLAAKDELKKTLQANSARNLFLLSELKTVQKLLNNSGIKSVAFKGPVLAESAYGDVCLRQFDDLDLLLEEKDILKAMKVLLQKEYKPLLAMSDNERKMHIREGWGCSLISPGNEYYLELDSGVVPRNYVFNIKVKEIHTRAVSIKIDGTQFKMPSIEDQVLLLCVHGGKHLWERFLWLCDLDGLIRRNVNLDWSAVTERAERSGTLRLLLLGLFLVEKYLNTEIPEGLSSCIESDPVVKDLAKYVTKYLEGSASGFDGWQETMPFNMKARERAGDRIIYLCRLLFTPSYSDWKKFKLPGWLCPLYYVIRPFRLFFKSRRRKSRDSSFPC